MHREYVRVGSTNMRPGIHTDRWSQPVPYWTAGNYGWLKAETWERVERFQKGPDCSDLFVGRPLILQGTPEFETIRRRVQEVLYLNPQRKTIWELNLLKSRPFIQMFPSEWIRFCAFFNESPPNLRRWTWVDAYIRLPWWRLVAWWMTKRRVQPQED